MVMSNATKSGIPFENIVQARRLWSRFLLLFFAITILESMVIGGFIFFDIPQGIQVCKIYGLCAVNWSILMTGVCLLLLIWHTAYKTGRLLNDSALTVIVSIMPILICLMPMYLARIGRQEGYRLCTFIKGIHPDIKK